MQTATSRSRALIGAPPEGVDGSFINNGTLLGARRAKQRVGHRRQQEWGAYSALVTAVSRNGAPTAPWLAPRLVRQPLDSPFHSAVVRSGAPTLLWTAVAPVALSEKAPVDFDNGQQRVTVGKFLCWLLSSL